MVYSSTGKYEHVAEKSERGSFQSQDALMVRSASEQAVGFAKTIALLPAGSLELSGAIVKIPEKMLIRGLIDVA